MDISISKISETDRLLIMRMEGRITALRESAEQLQNFISNHLTLVYSLSPGDRIEDNGKITRLPPITEGESSDGG